MAKKIKFDATFNFGANRTRKAKNGKQTSHKGKGRGGKGGAFGS